MKEEVSAIIATYRNEKEKQNKRKRQQQRNGEEGKTRNNSKQVTILPHARDYKYSVG